MSAEMEGLELKILAARGVIDIKGYKRSRKLNEEDVDSGRKMWFRYTRSKLSRMWRYIPVPSKAANK